MSHILVKSMTIGIKSNNFMQNPKPKKGVDYTGVCVVYFCHDGKGNVLMGKRSQKTRDEQGKWDIGGGSLEFGERVEEALKREVNEEYSTDVLKHEFLGFRDVHRTHLDTDQKISVIPLKKTHWIALDFKVLVDPSKVKNGEPESIDEIGWFTINRLPENLHSQLPLFFEKYKEQLK